MTDEHQPIRFLNDCRYGNKGTTNSTLPWGLRSTLVTYNRAVWVEDAPASEPVRNKSRKDTSDKGN